MCDWTKPDHRAKALKANNARYVNELEELTGKTVIVKSDPTLHQEQFDM